MTDEENDRPAWGKRDPLEVEAIRIRNGHSLHAEEDPSLCDLHCERHIGRVVDCCHRKPDIDVVECPRCGKQWETLCTFDEDFS